MAAHFKQEFLMAGVPFNPDVKAPLASIIIGSLLFVLIVYALVYVHYVRPGSVRFDWLVPAPVRVQWNRMFPSHFVFARFDNTAGGMETSTTMADAAGDSLTVGGVEFSGVGGGARYQRGATSFNNPLFKEGAAGGGGKRADDGDDDDEDGPKAGSSIEDISPHQFSEMIHVVDTANLVEVELGDASASK